MGAAGHFEWDLVLSSSCWKSNLSCGVVEELYPGICSSSSIRAASVYMFHALRLEYLLFCFLCSVPRRLSDARSVSHIV